jgi:hypothetical protein
MTGSAVMCAVIVALTSAIGLRGVIALLIALVAASCAVWGGRYEEQWVLRCPKSVRQLLTLVLLGIAIWLIVLIQGALWLKVPGAYGPVQYWGDDGRGFMGLRALAMFVMLLGLLLAVAVVLTTFHAFVVGSATSAWRHGIIPAIALAAFALAYWMFFEYGFFPSA